MMAYERNNIQQLSSYVPGEQPQHGRVCKLNTNENPYPPSPAVIGAIASVSSENLRRYPSPTAAHFREVAASTHNLLPSQVIATNGGDELLRLVISVFCEPNANNKNAGSLGGLGVTQPTYSLYDVLAGIHGTNVVRVPLKNDWSIPKNFAETLNQAGCKLAIVVNPHAPSGKLESLETLKKIAQELTGVLLIDEAYVNFSTQDALPLLALEQGLDNVLILRTLSKGYSLAGLRFGYGLGHPDLIATLDKARDSYNTDVLSQAAAVAALQSREHASQTWQKVIEARSFLTSQLTSRGYYISPSQTNFLLATPSKNQGHASKIYEFLKQKYIYVRYFDQDRLRDKLRITVGTPEQNQQLLTALDEFHHG